VHEPREDRLRGLLTELRAGKIIARPVEDAFFDRDLSLLNRPDSLGHAILLAAVPGVTDRIGGAARGRMRQSGGDLPRFSQCRRHGGAS
jgi:hypothetical protein